MFLAMSSCRLCDTISHNAGAAQCERYSGARPEGFLQVLQLQTDWILLKLGPGNCIQLQSIIHQNCKHSHNIVTPKLASMHIATKLYMCT